MDTSHRAIRFHAFGGLERLRLEEVPTRGPGGDEALVRVFAAAVNHLDLDLLAGTSRYEVHVPHTLGMEGAGVVEAVGADVTTASPGDRVLVATDVVCGHCTFCASGRNNLCTDAFRPGLTHSGAYSELMVLPARGLYRLPDQISFDSAASTQVSFGTAWHMLMTRGRLRAGETVLVMGAAGNIGLGAVRIAKLAGARVIAASASAEKRRRLQDEETDVTVDPSSPQFVNSVFQATDGHGVDIVYEHVGGNLLQKGLDCLRPGGRLVTCGAHGGEVASIDVIPFFRSELTIIGSNSASSDEIATVFRLVGQGKLVSTIGAVFPLGRAADALGLLVERGHYGRIVIRPQE